MFARVETDGRAAVEPSAESGPKRKTARRSFHPESGFQNAVSKPTTLIGWFSTIGWAQPISMGKTDQYG
jgi:hypothetical protein